MLDYKHQRIMVLAGDTGLGKTSMVKILAKHCGYDPYILHSFNDSDILKLNDKIV